MKENLKFKLDLLEARLARLKNEENAGKLFQTRFVLKKDDKMRNPREIESEIADVKRELSQRKIHHAITVVQRALKPAKQVELLKLKKRAKATPDNTKLVQEEDVVKSMDLAAWAKLIVSRTVTKYFTDLLRSKKEVMTAAGANVYGRMCKVAGVRAALDDLLYVLQQWYEPERPISNKRNAPGPYNATNMPVDRTAYNQDDAAPITKRPRLEDADEASQEQTNNEQNNGDVVQKREAWAESEDEGGFFDQDLGVADSDSDRQADEQGLPALQHGFISGSESEPEMDAAPVRKNRRGQRARRKIWEQKYGSRAAHIIKQEQEMAAKARQKQEKASRRTQKAQERKQKMEVLKNVDVKTLHPSWQAKKLQEKAASNVKFAGKKITFD